MAKARVEKLWPGETVAILASGPSLTVEDVNYVRGKARVIVINTTYKLAPWADCLYACDGRWWRWHKGAKEFPGLKFALQREAKHWNPDVTVLRNTGYSGLETDPTGLRNGRNGGYQALNLSYHLGVSKIVLLGYDMQLGPGGKRYWHKDHPSALESPYRAFRKQFETIKQPLLDAGITVLNCTRRTALETFPRVPLHEALPELSAEAVA
jgi:hypothetical protein